MPNFKIRSYKKELLDSEDIPFYDIVQNMKELSVINTWLGGHFITLKGTKNLLKKCNTNSLSTIIICEIGCGGGDNLQVIKKWLNKNNIAVKLIGIDINPNCIKFAQSKIENEDINFVCSNYNTVSFSQTPHIIFSSLFCHHLTDGECIEMLHWCKKNSTTGFFLNDLQRNPIAYYSIKFLTSLFSKSYLVKNDAPLSVLRGFNKSEINTLMLAANIKWYTISWKWAFRWLVCSYNNK
jgi:2-polyprenyl-3-methyl-5-hydroxy-6-metoxy-1,4-benzoquinol methylase